MLNVGLDNCIKLYTMASDSFSLSKPQGYRRRQHCPNTFKLLWYRLHIIIQGNDGLNLLMLSSTYFGC